MMDRLVTALRRREQWSRVDRLVIVIAAVGFAWAMLGVWANFSSIVPDCSDRMINAIIGRSVAECRWMIFERLVGNPVSSFLQRMLVTGLLCAAILIARWVWVGGALVRSKS